MYIVHCGTGTLWFGRSLKSSCPPDSLELMENLEQTISCHSRFWRFWSQCSVLIEPSSEREEAVCGRGAWQGACLPHSRLCPQVGGLTWFTGLLLYPAVAFFLILCFPGHSHQPWSRTMLGRKGFTDLPSVRQTTQFHLHLVSFLVIRGVSKI